MGEPIMKGIYGRLYRRHFGSIAQFHPQTAAKLQSIKRQYGTHAGYHAATLILSLEARMEVSGVQATAVLTDTDLEEFTYFKYMRDNLPALELLVELLECHVNECQALQCRPFHTPSPRIEQSAFVAVLE